MDDVVLAKLIALVIKLILRRPTLHTVLEFGDDDEKELLLIQLWGQFLFLILLLLFLILSA